MFATLVDSSGLGAFLGAFGRQRSPGKASFPYATDREFERQPLVGRRILDRFFGPAEQRRSRNNPGGESTTSKWIIIILG